MVIKSKIFILLVLLSFIGATSYYLYYIITSSININSKVTTFNKITTFDINNFQKKMNFDNGYLALLKDKKKNEQYLVIVPETTNNQDLKLEDLVLLRKFQKNRYNFIVYKNSIYYLKEWDEINQINLKNMTEKTLVNSDGDIFNFLINDDKLYYVSDSFLYEYNLSSSLNTKLTKLEKGIKKFDVSKDGSYKKVTGLIELLGFRNNEIYIGSNSNTPHLDTSYVGDTVYPAVTYNLTTKIVKTAETNLGQVDKTRMNMMKESCTYLTKKGEEITSESFIIDRLNEDQSPIQCRTLEFKIKKLLYDDKSDYQNFFENLDLDNLGFSNTVNKTSF